MPPRFEVVSDPIEYRLQQGVAAQATATWATLQGVAAAVSNNTNCALAAASAAFADAEFVGRVSTVAIELLSPRSLPGCLFACALLVRAARAVLVSRLAHAAVAKQYAAHKNK